MANILIIDDQAWVKDLCREGLAGAGHNVSTTDDIESVVKNILSFNPHIVLLNQYLKHGFLVWDVLQDIKMKHPNLPVLIVTTHDTHLFCPHLSQAEGYLVKSHTAANELRDKIYNLLNQLSVVQEDTEFPSPIMP
ncbi:MAG: response regulator [Deltaproteobacteria bacterium]|nr:response regulator [Deltaproteobacteria bacterium]